MARIRRGMGSTTATDAALKAGVISYADPMDERSPKGDNPHVVFKGEKLLVLGSKNTGGPVWDVRAAEGTAVFRGFTGGYEKNAWKGVPVGPVVDAEYIDMARDDALKILGFKNAGDPGGGTVMIAPTTELPVFTTRDKTESRYYVVLNNGSKTEGQIWLINETDGNASWVGQDEFPASAGYRTAPVKAEVWYEHGNIDRYLMNTKGYQNVQDPSGLQSLRTFTGTAPTKTGNTSVASSPTELSPIERGKEVIELLGKMKPNQSIRLTSMNRHDPAYQTRLGTSWVDGISPAIDLSPSTVVDAVVMEDGNLFVDMDDETKGEIAIHRYRKIDLSKIDWNDFQKEKEMWSRLARIRRGMQASSGLASIRQTSFREPSNQTEVDRKAEWWRDKSEWFRQVRGVMDDNKVARDVAHMWQIMGDAKKEGVLDGTYDYTGKGLASGNPVKTVVTQKAVVRPTKRRGPGPPRHVAGQERALEVLDLIKNAPVDSTLRLESTGHLLLYERQKPDGSWSPIKTAFSGFSISNLQSAEFRSDGYLYLEFKNNSVRIDPTVLDWAKFIREERRLLK